MNPIIKALALQAGLGFDDNLVVADEPIYFVTQVELEKFAGLIIEECLSIVNRKEYSYHEADPLWETAQLIKQHFGVEP
jgi:hypothetical protein